MIAKACRWMLVCVALPLSFGCGGDGGKQVWKSGTTGKPILPSTEVKMTATQGEEKHESSERQH